MCFHSSLSVNRFMKICVFLYLRAMAVAVPLSRVVNSPQKRQEADFASYVDYSAAAYKDVTTGEPQKRQEADFASYVDYSAAAYKDVTGVKL